MYFDLCKMQGLFGSSICFPNEIGSGLDYHSSKNIINLHMRTSEFKGMIQKPINCDDK